MKMRLPQAIDTLRMDPTSCLVHKIEDIQIGHTNGRGFWILFDQEDDSYYLPYDNWELSNTPQNGSDIGQEFM